MLSRLALIPLLLFSMPWSHHGPGNLHRHIGAWTLRTNTDRFSGVLSCRLSAHDVEYGRGALVFHLPERIDTSTAIYRVDAGAPVWVSTEMMEMARRGFALNQDDLANPSGGLVRVPEERVTNARTVMVEAGKRGWVTSFKIDGFAAALAAARAAGCTPEDFALETPRP
jgi:hypothetical protein